MERKGLTEVVVLLVCFRQEIMLGFDGVLYGIDSGDREHTGGIVENVENGSISAIPVHRWIRNSDQICNATYMFLP